MSKEQNQQETSTTSDILSRRDFLNAAWKTGIVGGMVVGVGGVGKLVYEAVEAVKVTDTNILTSEQSQVFKDLVVAEACSPTTTLAKGDAVQEACDALSLDKEKRQTLQPIWDEQGEKMEDTLPWITGGCAVAISSVGVAAVREIIYNFKQTSTQSSS